MTTAERRNCSALTSGKCSAKHTVTPQARADKALEGYGPGVNPEALKKELLVCQRVCEVWHVENSVMRELQWYSSFPQLLQELRRKLCNIRAAVNRRRTARPCTTFMLQKKQVCISAYGGVHQHPCAVHMLLQWQCPTALALPS